jgi:hypothetical protein
MKDAFLLPIVIISFLRTNSYACDLENCLNHNLFSSETSYLEQYGGCDAGHFQKQIVGRHNLVYTKSFMFSEKLPAIYSDFINTCKSSKCKYKNDGSITKECSRAYNLLFDENKKKIVSAIPSSMTVDHITKSKKSECSSEDQRLLKTVR